MDGLKGLPDAITAAFPETMVQTCVRHWARTNGAFNGSLPLIRQSMTVCSWKDRKARSLGRQSPGLFSDPPRTAGLRPVHEAPTADEAARQLEAFEEKWARKYPSIAPAWRRAGAEVTPFHAFSAAIRKIMDTTNAVESLNRARRKTLKTRGSFPTGDAAAKRAFLAIRNFEKGGRAAREGVAARNQLAIMFIGRSDA